MHRFGGGRHREIDHNVGGDGEVVGDRNAQRLHAGDDAGVFAQSGMFPRLNGRHNRNLVVG